MTITAEALLAAGYEPQPPRLVDRCSRLFQRSVEDEFGRLCYTLTFREWNRLSTSDAVLATEATDGGYIWATLKYPTIEATEQAAETIWRAVGAIYYEALM